MRGETTYAGGKLLSYVGGRLSGSLAAAAWKARQPGAAALRAAANKVAGNGGEAFLTRFLGGGAKASLKTTQGWRFVDNLLDGHASEAKVGYQCLTKFIREEMEKDAELLATGQVKSVTWYFMKSDATQEIGGSWPLLQELAKRGINTVYIIPK